MNPWKTLPGPAPGVVAGLLVNLGAGAGEIVLWGMGLQSCLQERRVGLPKQYPCLDLQQSSSCGTCRAALPPSAQRGARKSETPSQKLGRETHSAVLQLAQLSKMHGQVLRVVRREEAQAARTELPAALQRPAPAPPPASDAPGLARHLAIADIQARLPVSSCSRCLRKWDDLCTADKAAVAALHGRCTVVQWVLRVAPHPAE